MEQRQDLVGRLDTTKKTSSGGIKAPVYLTRTGIFEYRRADGSVTRELRPEEEVFHEDSLDSLRGAPLTVLHPDSVNEDNWRSVSVGHVGDNLRRKDEIYIEGTAHVQEKGTKARVLKKGPDRLVEVSCGYTVDIDQTPGVYNGERYDCVQRNIRYNHVALGPENFGRAGNEVRLRLDGIGTPILPGMTVEQLTSERDAAQGRADALEANVTAEKTRADKAESDLATLKAAFPSMVEKRADLLTKANGFKVETAGKSDHEIRLACLEASGVKLDTKKDSESYVEARFDLLLEVKPEPTRKVDGECAPTKDPIVAAYENLCASHTVK